jgi:hypothetical protein
MAISVHVGTDVIDVLVSITQTECVIRLVQLQCVISLVYIHGYIHSLNNTHKSLHDCMKLNNFPANL